MTYSEPELTALSEWTICVHYGDILQTNMPKGGQ